jgi:ubiE/COQ5 methyltransferase family
MSSGRLYETALLGPLAEQLVEAAGIVPGMRVVDVLGDAGVLTRRLATTIGPSGSVVTVVGDDDSARALAQELRESRTIASEVVASPDDLPFEEREFDAALSLLRLTGDVGTAALREMERVAHHAAAIVTATSRPLPEDLLARAWQEVTAAIPPALAPAAAALPPDGWTATPMRDVARFDRAQQLWMALCDHLGIPMEDAEAIAVSRHFNEALVAFQGADGTLRIPIEVSLLRLMRD